MSTRLKKLFRKDVNGNTVKLSVCHQTLSTYELLEANLQHLDPPDLRNSKLVASNWNKVIVGSHSLHARWQIPPVRKPRDGRVLLLGDSYTGKRALISRWNMNSFAYDVFPGIDDAYRKQVKIDREIWSIALDSECGYREHDIYRFTQNIHALIWNRDCYALVYSVDSRRSFENVQPWQRHIDDLRQRQVIMGTRSARADPAALVALIATKCDVQDPEVSSDEGRALAQRLDCAFYETSARVAFGCEEAYDGLVRSCKRTIDAPTLVTQGDSLNPATIGLGARVHRRLELLRQKPPT